MNIKDSYIHGADGKGVVKFLYFASAAENNILGVDGSAYNAKAKDLIFLLADIGGTKIGLSIPTWNLNTTGSAGSVLTVKRSTNANHFLTFVDSNNDLETAESIYTAVDIKYNPSTKTLTVPNLSTNSGITIGNTFVAIGSTYSPVTSITADSTDDDIPSALAVWNMISSGLQANDAMVFRGIINGGSSTSNTTYTVASNCGDVYKVGTAGWINGDYYEPGDTFICSVDNTAAATASNVTTIKTKWYAIQTNITDYLLKSGGTMTGPLSWKDTTALPSLTTFGTNTTILVQDGMAANTNGVTKQISVATLLAALNLSPTIEAGTATNTVKITVGGTNSSDYTIPYSVISDNVNLLVNSTITTSGAGWFRIASYTNASDMCRGLVKFSIITTGSSWSPHVQIIEVDGTWSHAGVADCRIIGNGYITKVRTTYDSSKVYIEIYTSEALSGSLRIIKNSVSFGNVNDSWNWNTGTLPVGGGTEAFIFEPGSNGLSINGSIFSSGYIYSNGFVHNFTPNSGKTKNDYVLLAGGSYKAISDFATSFTVLDNSPTLTTDLLTIATIAGVDIKAKITNYNTDYKVRQASTTSNKWRSVLLGYTEYANWNTAVGDNIDNQSYITDSIRFQPSTSSLRIGGNLIVGGYIDLPGLGEGFTIHADPNYFGTNNDGILFTIKDGNDTVCDGGIVFRSEATKTNPSNIVDWLVMRYTGSGNGTFTWLGNTIAHASNIINKNATIGTSSVTIATIAGVDITASITNYDTWRNIYVGNTSTIGTGTDTKAINYTAGEGMSVTYSAAGTGTGKSGNSNYFNITYTNTGVHSTTINGNYLRVNTNGTDADLTIPYATLSGSTNILNPESLNSESDIVLSGVRAYSGVGSSWTGSIATMAYAAILTFGNPSRGWQIWAQRANNPGMYWRRGTSDQTDWEDPRLFLDSVNSSVSGGGSAIGDSITVNLGGSSATLTIPTISSNAVELFNNNKTLTVANWVSIAAIDNYDEGTYAISISSAGLYASGIFSICKGTDVMTDEIVLHVSNKTSGATWRPYARVSSKNLELSCNESTGTSRTYTVKILKLI